MSRNSRHVLRTRENAVNDIKSSPNGTLLEDAPPQIPIGRLGVRSEPSARLRVVGSKDRPARCSAIASPFLHSKLKARSSRRGLRSRFLAHEAPRAVLRTEASSTGSLGK